MDLQLSGKNVLITGASMGIGAHLAETFAEEKVNLHLTARSTDKLEKLRNRILASHDVDVTLHSSDLTKSCLLYTSPSPRDATLSRMPSSA